MCEDLVPLIEAEDVGMDEIDGVIWQTDTGLYESVMVYGKPGYTKTKIQLIPLKEGKGTLKQPTCASHNSGEIQNSVRFVCCTGEKLFIAIK